MESNNNQKAYKIIIYLEGNYLNFVTFNYERDNYFISFVDKYGFSKEFKLDSVCSIEEIKYKEDCNNGRN